MKMSNLRIRWAWLREDNRRLVRLLLIVVTFVSTVSVVILAAAANRV
ncbi:hypothetical protein ATK36_5416 [Amycolatopsis sulphurea]|uniref:Uncharacterized protein n=1 Tax=Amycolatopsis sulphurea TaxID=76022 RepID=A0A2A9FFI0_9PSEU|nr:hypothetical protein ATK36_5416 [Amycolatopsis sulphurea]